MQKIIYTLLTGDSLFNHIEEISSQRIETFKEFPYLYQGNLDYEKKYLEAFINTPDSFIMSAKADDKLVGFITATTLANEVGVFENIQSLLENDSVEIESCYYIGEGIIIPEYRGKTIAGKNIARQLLKHTETEIINRGYAYSSFATVIRPEDHPLRPANYSSLDKIFAYMDYKKSAIEVELEWPTIMADGSINDQLNPMVFWFKNLLS